MIHTSKASVDTFVIQTTAYAKRNYTTYKTLHVRNLASHIRYSYVLPSIPFKPAAGVNVLNGKFRLWTYGAWTGTNTVTVRPISEKWTRNRMTWAGTGLAKRPGVRASSVSVTKTGGATRTMWEFDIKDILQSVSNGTAWFGLRIEIDTSTLRQFYGSEGTAAYRPELEVEWSDAPQEPTALIPSQGRHISVQYPTFQTDFVDRSGDTSMAGMRIQISDTEDFTVPDWDSGDFPTLVPEMITDPAAPGYVAPPGGAWGGVALGGNFWWRAQVKDGAGFWSSYSDPEQVFRTAKLTATLNNPPLSGEVSDGTPVVDWTINTGVQTAFNVIIRDSLARVVWASGKTSSTDTSITVPASAALKTTEQYEVELQLWDNVARMTIPNDPTYLSIVRSFSYVFKNTVLPFTDLVAARMTDRPGIVLTFDRADQPDRIDIYRDDALLFSGMAEDLFTAGTSYQYEDRFAPAHHSSTYRVVAVVNSIGSLNSPTVSIVPYIKAPYIALPGGEGLWLFNPEKELTKGESQELVQFVGNHSSMVVQTGRRGFEGSLGGLVTRESAPDLSSMKEIKARLEAILDDAGAPREIHIVDEAFDGYLYGAVYDPMKDTEGMKYAVSLSFGENL